MTPAPASPESAETRAFAEGEGVGERAGMLAERADCVAALELRAVRVMASVAPDRIQPHTRMLPTVDEIAVGERVARELRIVAHDLTQGLHEGSAAVQRSLGELLDSASDGEG